MQTDHQVILKGLGLLSTLYIFKSLQWPFKGAQSEIPTHLAPHLSRKLDATSYLSTTQTVEVHPLHWEVSILFHATSSPLNDLIKVNHWQSSQVHQEICFLCWVGQLNSKHLYGCTVFQYYNYMNLEFSIITILLNSTHNNSK